MKALLKQAFFKQVLLLLLAALLGAGVTWGLLEKGPTAHEHEQHAGEAVGGHEEHGEEGEHGHEEGGESHAITLTPEQLKANGLRIETATEAAFASVLELPGQLVLNNNQEARVLSPVSGIVRTAPAQIGQQVSAGTVLAVLESRDLADAAALYLGSRERRALAETTFSREEDLWKKKISAEQDYLAARRDVNEAHIEEQSALQKLLALGVTETDARHMKAGGKLASYPLRSPIAGTVLSRELTVGEALSADKPVFRIANLGTLWVDLSIPASDLSKVRAGQRVLIANSNGVTGEGRVLFVQPELVANSRSGSVRVQTDNRQNQWRVGQFIKAQLVTGESGKVLSVPSDAVLSLDGKTVVFINDADGLEPREVTTGRRSADRVEIRDGLKAGESYAAGAVFVLKADLKKGEAEHEH